MAHHVRRLGSALLLLCVLLTGCAQHPTPIEQRFMAMDTYMHFTVYGDEDAAVQAQNELLTLDRLLSVTDSSSEVYAINHRPDHTCDLSPELTVLLEQALILARQTGGAFDPTVYPVVRAWGFTTSPYRVPDGEELVSLLPLVGHEKVVLDGHTLTLPKDMQLDFGGIAKGWAGDRAAQQLRARGVTSAILRLGGNIHTVGSKPDGSPWKIGLEDPDSGDALGTVAVSDLAVVTSGSYQRFFTANGQTYHHIIDPATGQPADSGLISVTVIGKYGTRCDALSTALFVMGLEDAVRFWQEHKDFEAVFVSEDGSVSITAGLEGNFTLSAGQTRTLEVLG